MSGIVGAVIYKGVKINEGLAFAVGNHFRVLEVDGDVEIIREKDNVRLLKVGCRNSKVSYCVIGNGSTRHYDDYGDALDEISLAHLQSED